MHTLVIFILATFGFCSAYQLGFDIQTRDVFQSIIENGTFPDVERNDLIVLSPFLLLDHSDDMPGNGEDRNEMFCNISCTVPEFPDIGGDWKSFHIPWYRNPWNAMKKITLESRWVRAGLFAKYRGHYVEECSIVTYLDSKFYKINFRVLPPKPKPEAIISTDSTYASRAVVFGIMTISLSIVLGPFGIGVFPRRNF